MAPTIIRHGAAMVLAAGALAAGAGTASAAPLTAAPQIATGHHAAFHRDFCDDFHHRGDGRCRGDRWTWDRAHRCWHHDRWDGRRWNRRG